MLFTVDHHHGSEENQAGWEHHDDSLVDPATGRMDTLPAFLRTCGGAGLEGVVVGVVGLVRRDRHALGRRRSALVFIDGGHGVEPARADYEAGRRRSRPAALLAIHDVFPDPADGGRPPYEQIYLPALAPGSSRRSARPGSLRVLRRV